MGRIRIISWGVGAVAMLLVVLAGSAQADSWLPHPASAHWQYFWKDSTYNPTGTTENVDVQQQAGPSFTLAWAAGGLPPTAAQSAQGLHCPAGADLGSMQFLDLQTGLTNTNWSSCPAPAAYPTNFLCQAGTTGTCPDSLSSYLYNVIWGNRSPLLSEPLLRGISWNSTGGASGDVASTSRYIGLQLVKVPAFPGGVVAAVVRTDFALAGTPGDEYGSGERTTWWVRGVGPVRFSFDHVDGSVTTGYLLSTNLRPAALEPDQNYFPLKMGLRNKYRWTNRRHLKRPEVETVTVGAAAGNVARLDVASVSGPLRAAGSYVFKTTLSGVTNLSGSTAAATLAKLPKLGHNRHFFNPLDMMTYGFNPLLPAYPRAGASWHSGNVRDFHVYGVTGSTRIIGVRTVRVPAGRFRALEVRSVLTQRGHPFGSGVRTMWFAAGRGLVKLVFRHRDHSTSIVQLIR